jgi:hypothetical protein
LKATNFAYIFKKFGQTCGTGINKDNQFEMEGVENSSLSFSHKKGTFFSLVPIETHAVFFAFLYLQLHALFFNFL